MSKPIRLFVAPAYLLLCLLIGGSAQAIWGNMLLQLLGLAIFAWAIVERRQEPLARPARQMLWLAGIAIAAVVLQLVPLPFGLWSRLGGREPFAQGFATLGLGTPAFPLSLTPYKTLSALIALIPPMAMFVAIVRLKAYRGVYLSVALLAGTMAGILLGTMQLSSTPGGANPWNLYAETNYHVAVGFFANADHMATLLVISIPFLAALLSAARSTTGQRYWVFAALAAGVGMLLLIGLALNGSLAGYGLTLPVLTASLLILLRPESRYRRWILLAAAVLMIGAVAALSSSDIGSRQIGAHAASAVGSRADILATSARAVGNFMPFGSGLGSFVDVYPMFEDAASIGRTYVIHAHNDYVEIAIELGVVGILLMAAFLAWWGAAVWRLWRSSDAGAFSRAASIASAAILVHSLVDFPLRTAAISACFGLCVALLADRRAPQIAHEDDLRPTRHLVFR